MRFLSLSLLNSLQTPPHLLHIFSHFPCCYSVNSPLNPISNQLWPQSLLIGPYSSHSSLPSPIRTFQYSSTLQQGSEVSF